MGLQIDFFYSPEFVTWDHDTGSDAYPKPELSLTIATESGYPGDVVIVGKSLHHMLNVEGHQRARRHLVVLPDDLHTGKVTAVIRWLPSGLTVEGHGRNPVHVREWGRRRRITAARITSENPAVVERLDARVVGRFPGDGAWFRTTPTPDFAPKKLTPDPDGTPLTEVPVHPLVVRQLFYCPSYPLNVQHVLLNPDACPDPDHDRRRKRLALVVAYYLRWLTWPPQGWEIPPDEAKDMIPRYAFSGEKRPPTTPRDNLIKELFDEAAMAVTEETMLDHLVDGGLITWAEVKDLVSFMEKQAPVDWGKSPRNKRHITPLGAVRPIQYRCVEL